ncbi:enoyl-CoA hydratase/isomerase family protein [Acinetobacter shaoyimingii]|uniref:enoyl-CoA hydratase/isomerase family protein n=1 Tax=Acinetobacter shaoyimingii TaxID=2715164 RepID=UPI0014908411|nr:enoyl-CoA hydratase/isomerase family protein [Acinetobacter shaoyimingii]
MNIENKALMDQLHIEKTGHLGVIALNRVAYLNALTLEMIQGITKQLSVWHNDPEIQAILIQSNSPKAFCAGGDIRYLYDGYMNGTDNHKAYFSAEYDMLNTIRAYAKPVIVLLDGYVLGGGFGLAQACHMIISSEKSRFAMPETVIGFFPDVGATHFLSRLDDIGVYLALTGEQISSSDALYLDLIDYHIPSEQFQHFREDLSKATDLSKDHISQMIGRYIVQPVESELRQYAEIIQQHFASDDLATIENGLAQESNPKYRDWAQKTLSTLEQRSYIAKKTSLKLQHLGRGLSLAQCMQLERQLQDIWLDEGDFIEGVRALIVDKDKQPKWKKENPKLDLILDQLG